jgi:hypothetical protein
MTQEPAGSGRTDSPPERALAIPANADFDTWLAAPVPTLEPPPVALPHRVRRGNEMKR